MLPHKEMIAAHAGHRLVITNNFPTIEKYVLYLIHTFAYHQASKLAKNKTVLDLGCNNGYGSEILFGSAKNVVGVDVSEKAVSAAKDKYKNLPIEFKTIDGISLPFEDNSFEMIVSFQVLEHIVNQNLYIEEIKRVLAPDGLVLFTTPNALIRLFEGMKPWNRFHIREFAPNELGRFLESFFSAVGILGLFAEEPLYSIELNRVDRKRKALKDKNTANKKESFARSSNSQIEYGNPDKLKMFVQVFADKYGTKDLFYKLDDLVAAMDLLAVCTDNERILRTTISQLLPQNV